MDRALPKQCDWYEPDLQLGYGRHQGQKVFRSLDGGKCLSLILICKYSKNSKAAIIMTISWNAEWTDPVLSISRQP